MIERPIVEHYKQLRLVVHIEDGPAGVRTIRCSELDDVLKGVWFKMVREGFQGRLCRYRKTEEVGPDAWRGTVGLFR